MDKKNSFDSMIKSYKGEAEPFSMDRMVYPPPIFKESFKIPIKIYSAISAFVVFSLVLICKFVLFMQKNIGLILSFIFPKSIESDLLKEGFDSEIFGSVLFLESGNENKPIHNLSVVFFVKNLLFQWKAISLSHTDSDGNFVLPYKIKESRNIFILSRRVEIYCDENIYNSKEKRVDKKMLVKSLVIPKNDLIGMRYDIGKVQISFWNYSDDSIIPRVILNNKSDVLRHKYAEGRAKVFNEVFFYLTMIKTLHLIRLKRDPYSLSIAEIGKDYPENLTSYLEKEKPGLTRADEWFSYRMKNGMYAASFLKVKEQDEGYFWVKFFGKCQYESNGNYAFPSVKIKFRDCREKGISPVEIFIEGIAGKSFTPDDQEKWLQAKRIARVSASLSAELDDHLVGTHLVAEQYAIAAYRNLRFNPVAKLLLPHLKEVVLINKSSDYFLTGIAKPEEAFNVQKIGVLSWVKNRVSGFFDRLVFGNPGYIPSASALTSKGIFDRSVDIMGVHDWKCWGPMKPIDTTHYFAHSQNAYWKMLDEYVTEFFDENIEKIKENWVEILRFSDDLVFNSVSVFLSRNNLDDLDENERRLLEERFEWYCFRYSFDPSIERTCIDGELKVVSKITNKPYATEKGVENLKYLCRYCIMMTTFMHSFFNEHQNEDIGEVLYGSLGLRYAENESDIMSPETNLDISPPPDISTKMLWFSNLLSKAGYGYITKNEDRDINPRMIDLLKKHQKAIEIDGYGISIDKIKSRVNI